MREFFLVSCLLCISEQCSCMWKSYLGNGS